MWKKKNNCWPVKPFCGCYGSLLLIGPAEALGFQTRPYWFEDWNQFRVAAEDVLMHLIHGDQKAVFNLILLSPSWLPFSFSPTHHRPTEFFPSDLLNQMRTVIFPRATGIISNASPRLIRSVRSRPGRSGVGLDFGRRSSWLSVYQIC